MINHKFPAGSEQRGAPRGSVVPSEGQWPQKGISGPGWMEEMRDLVWIQADYFMAYKVLKHTDYC